MTGHVHRDPVRLPDGTVITAVSYFRPNPYARAREPQYGLYLDRRWQPPWDHDHLDWPDFGVPADRPVVLSSLRSLMDRARQGQVVEIGCLGGHGRTGTALALLAVLAGHPRDDAVAWVRNHYCAEAVETRKQSAYVQEDDQGRDQLGS